MSIPEEDTQPSYRSFTPPDVKIIDRVDTGQLTIKDPDPSGHSITHWIDGRTHIPQWLENPPMSQAGLMNAVSHQNAAATAFDIDQVLRRVAEASMKGHYWTRISRTDFHGREVIVRDVPPALIAELRYEEFLVVSDGYDLYLQWGRFHPLEKLQRVLHRLFTPASWRRP